MKGIYENAQISSLLYNFHKQALSENQTDMQKDRNKKRGAYKKIKRDRQIGIGRQTYIDRKKYRQIYTNRGREIDRYIESDTYINFTS